MQIRDRKNHYDFNTKTFKRTSIFEIHVYSSSSELVDTGTDIPPEETPTVSDNNLSSLSIFFALRKDSLRFVVLAGYLFPLPAAGINRDSGNHPRQQL